MNKFTRSMKAGIQGYKAGIEVIKPARYQGGGHQIRCLQCGGDVFQEQETGLFGLGTILTCDRCGLSQLYGKKPERLPA
jgi:predicted nucleic-acid-binding Zn-ribbon protein